MTPPRSPASPAARDWGIGIVLLAVTAAYLSAMPRSLGWADESYFLYESKRLADGEILYRDVFQFLTPLAPYAMAALFSLFGADIITAHLSTAVLHGLTVLTLWLAARALGVGRWLALLPPAAYLAVSQPAWPFASWHWYGTWETALLLLLLVHALHARRPATMLLPGLMCGVLIATQQQKGVIMAVGLAAVIAADHLLRRRGGAGAPARALLAASLAAAAGILLIAGGVLLLAAAQAGVTALTDALVRFPLESYPARKPSSWGFVGPISARFSGSTFPLVLKYVPLLVIPQAVIILVAAARGRMGAAVPPSLAVLVMAAAAAASILYAPDYIHIAFIAPVFYLGGAQWLQWGMDAIPERWSRPCRVGIAAIVIAATVLLLHRNAARAWHEHPLSHATAFGRIDFEHRWQIIMIDTVRALLDRVPSRTLFCYPSISAPYLLAGGRNPTPYQFFLAGVSPPAHTRRVLEILATQDVPYIVYLPIFSRQDDPIRRVIEERYRFVDIPALAGVRPAANVWLYARHDIAGQVALPETP